MPRRCKYPTTPDTAQGRKKLLTHKTHKKIEYPSTVRDSLLNHRRVYPWACVIFCAFVLHPTSWYFNGYVHHATIYGIMVRRTKKKKFNLSNHNEKKKAAKHSTPEAIAAPILTKLWNPPQPCCQSCTQAFYLTCNTNTAVDNLIPTTSTITGAPEASCSSIRALYRKDISDPSPALPLDDRIARGVKRIVSMRSKHNSDLTSQVDDLSVRLQSLSIK